MTTDPFEQLLGLRSAPDDRTAADSTTSDTAAAERAGSTLTPEPPDREFVHQLRSQLHDALGLSSSERRQGNIFYFTLPAPDPERSRRFWSNVLGWELEESPGGFNIESTTQPGGLSGGTPEGGPTVWLRVVDIHEAARAVVALGGRAGTPVQYPTGWSLDCVAPGGARFNLSVPADAYDHDPAYGRSHGDLFYVSLPAPDADTSMDFFRRVVGWEFDPPGSAGGIHVANAITECGLGGGREGEHPELFFRVDDLEVAGERVATNGGELLSDVMEGPEGRHLLCDDGQGTVFGLSEPAPGY